MKAKPSSKSEQGERPHNRQILGARRKPVKPIHNFIGFLSYLHSTCINSDIWF